MCTFFKFCTGALLVVAAALPALSHVLPQVDKYVGNPCRLPSGVLGRCTLITDCPDALDAVRRGTRRGLQGTRERCGFERNVEVVCCDTRSGRVGNENPLVRRPGVPSQVPKKQTEWVRPTRGDKDHNALSEMKSTIACRKYAQDCPKSVSPFITGGTVADLGEFPHMAVLGYPISKNGMNISWLCGGTLISERYVMTAAHCALLSSKKPVVVRLGELDLSTNDDGADPVDYAVENVEIHPNFVASARYHDLALIRLAKPVKFTTTVCPACLYTMNSRGRAVSSTGVDSNELNDRILSNGEEIGPRINDEVDLRQRILIVSGWGSTQYLDESSPVLQKAVIKPFSIAECNDTLTRASGRSSNPLMPQGINPNAMMCAGDRKGNKDTCQGDSGGPLQFIDKDSSLYTVIGITSFGDKCGSSLPAIYTRVSSYVSWIEDKVW